MGEYIPSVATNAIGHEGCPHHYYIGSGLDSQQDKLKWPYECHVLNPGGGISPQTSDTDFQSTNHVPTNIQGYQQICYMPNGNHYTDGIPGYCVTSYVGTAERSGTTGTCVYGTMDYPCLNSPEKCKPVESEGPQFCKTDSFGRITECGTEKPYEYDPCGFPFPPPECLQPEDPEPTDCIYYSWINACLPEDPEPIPVAEGPECDPSVQSCPVPGCDPSLQSCPPAPTPEPSPEPTADPIDEPECDPSVQSCPGPWL